MFDPKKIFDLIKNAGEMQKKVAETLKNQKVVGEAAGGMVKVHMNGQFEVEALSIDPSILSEGTGFIEDVVKAAVNDAASQVRLAMADQLKNLTGGFGL